MVDDPSHDQHPLAAIQVERNRITRTDWQQFSSHRARVNDLLLGAASPDKSTLCILGAGNGNDIDLPMLAERFERITLVDLDREALDHCLAKQPAKVCERVDAIAGVDLSGILTSLDASRSAVYPMNDLIARARTPLVGCALRKYDVVASTCLLTQLIDSVATSLGSEHRRFNDLALAIRDGHLQLICDLAAAGGTIVLITDFVSSDTLPELRTVTSEQLESLLVQAIHGGNFFTGVNPGVLVRRMQESAMIEPSSVHLDAPWRWQMGHRAYGVCAVTARKRSST